MSERNPLITVKRRLRELKYRIRVESDLARRQAPSRTDSRFVVALTSYPGRLEHARLPVFSLLHQSIRPAVTALILAEDQFAGRVMPKWLAQAERQGLSLMWVKEDIKSYKKLIPVIHAFPASFIVTADDDTLYPRDWLERLMFASDESPGSIIGYRGSRIVTSNGNVSPYAKWPGATRATPPDEVFLSGAGGILYPPDCLASEVSDMALARELCPSADDIWFRAMALRKGTPSRLVTAHSVEFPVVRNSQRVSRLSRVNVDHGGNDVQFRSVFDHFDLWNRLS